MTSGLMQCNETEATIAAGQSGLTIFLNCQNTKPHSLNQILNSLNQFVEYITHSVKHATSSGIVKTLFTNVMNSFCTIINTFSDVCAVLDYGLYARRYFR